MAPTTHRSRVPPVRQGDVVVLSRDGLDALIAALRDEGYDVKGPTVRSGAIVPGPVSGVRDLPVGYRDEQSAGRYRVVQEDDERCFEWAVGPGSWRAEFFPAKQEQWRAVRSGDTYSFVEPQFEERPLAIFGARPCEVAAIGVLDKVLGEGTYRDARYQHRRDGLFVVVAECGAPASTCFCTSMGTGPGAVGGFDLALSEISDDDGHRFVVRVASERGGAVLSTVAGESARSADLVARERVLEGASGTMSRRMPPGIAAVLAQSQESPRWAEIAERCLSCANCTLVCPTCFCSDVHDVTDLSGAVIRERTWSSCFDLEHSYLHGGSVRASGASRYRQWMTHKLSTWWDQFDTSGCVGCGRCIAWCPVGIDITEEAAILAQSGGPHESKAGAQ